MGTAHRSSRDAGWEEPVALQSGENSWRKSGQSLFALDTKLDLGPDATRADVLKPSTATFSERYADRLLSPIERFGWSDLWFRGPNGTGVAPNSNPR
jgi:hypothetical protein